MRNRIIAFGLLIIIITTSFFGCDANKEKGIYADKANWAYYESDKKDAKADVFFVCPTVYFGEEGAFNMPLDDVDAKKNFVGAINMEKGIYDAESRFFAPYYKQAGLNVYRMAEKEQQPYLDTAFADVKAAFEYYINNENKGNPIILAGFSQGADMCIRLLKDCFKDEKINKLLVACYAIGWRITESEMAENPHLKFAKGEDDTGVIISFNSEAQNIDKSLIIPQGTKTLAINPLNWKTDGTVADKTENKGACFTDYDGKITEEINNLTGAYIDTTRGALKVTDVSADDYPARIDLFENGEYHLYDYQFFFRNLQENVEVRLNAFQARGQN